MVEVAGMFQVRFVPHATHLTNNHDLRTKVWAAQQNERYRPTVFISTSSPTTKWTGGICTYNHLKAHPPSALAFLPQAPSNVSPKRQGQRSEKLLRHQSDLHRKPLKPVERSATRIDQSTTSLRLAFERSKEAAVKIWWFCSSLR